MIESQDFGPPLVIKCNSPDRAAARLQPCEHLEAAHTAQGENDRREETIKVRKEKMINPFSLLRVFSIQFKFHIEAKNFPNKYMYIQT